MRHTENSILKHNQILGDFKLLNYIVFLPEVLAIFTSKHLPTYVVGHVAFRNLLEAVLKYDICHVAYDKVGVM